MKESGLILIAGLGNPGRQYQNTRHNAGFQVLDFLSQKLSIPLDKCKFDAEFGRGMLGGKKLVLAKPQSYMNRSGIPLQRLAGFFAVEISNLIVVYDDIDLPFGRIRIREKGGHGGHNGVRSLIQCFATQAFPRVRIGVGRPEGEGDLASYVLGSFSLEERGAWLNVVENAGNALCSIVEKGLLAAMQMYHV